MSLEDQIKKKPCFFESTKKQNKTKIPAHEVIKASHLQ